MKEILKDTTDTYLGEETPMNGNFEFRLETCYHDWSIAPFLLMSSPPQQSKICRKCGKTEIEYLGRVETNDYEETVKKFEVKK